MAKRSSTAQPSASQTGSRRRSIAAKLKSLFGTILAFDDPSSRLRSLFVNGLILFLLASSVPILVREVVNDGVLIDSISVPVKLEEIGYSETVVANRLWDAWTQLGREAAQAKETRSVLPKSQRIEFSIPDSGLSFESLIHHLRGIFGLQRTTVSGELVCGDPDCEPAGQSLRLRVVGKDVATVELPQRGATSENDYWKRAMAEVLLRVDPVRGIMAIRLLDGGAAASDARAVTELLKLVRAGDPEEDWAQAYAGSLLYGLGRKEEGMQHLNAVLERNPAFAFAASQKVSALLDGGDVRGARTEVLKLLERDPDNTEYLMLLGWAEWKGGDPKAAFAAFDKASTLEPNNVDILLRRGETLYQAGDLKRSIAEFEKAAEVDPERRDAHEYLALLHSLDGNLAKAIDSQRLVVQLSPDDLQAQGQLAILLHAAGHSQEALAVIEKAAAGAAAPRKFVLAHADILLALGRPEESLAILRGAEAADANSDEIQIKIGDALFALARYAEAQKAYETYIANNPDTAWAALAKAKLEMVKKSF